MLKVICIFNAKVNMHFQCQNKTCNAGRWELAVRVSRPHTHTHLRMRCRCSGAERRGAWSVRRAWRPPVLGCLGPETARLSHGSLLFMLSRRFPSTQSVSITSWPHPAALMHEPYSTLQALQRGRAARGEHTHTPPSLQATPTPPPPTLQAPSPTPTDSNECSVWNILIGETFSAALRSAEIWTEECVKPGRPWP